MTLLCNKTGLPLLKRYACFALHLVGQQLRFSL